MKNEICCNCTDEEIAKSFIEDVEAVKDRLEGQPCEDCISRQAVLNLAKFDGRDGLGSIIHAFDVEQLPPVTPAEKSNKWIHVSERLPEDHKDVLICLSSDQICIGCYNGHRLPFSNHAIGWGASYAHNWCSNDVIAWMPLSEPYKQEV